MARDPYRYFRLEARELAQGLRQGLARGETVRTLLRLAHTLKGAARVVKEGGIAERAHAIEEALVPFRDVETKLDEATVRQILTLLDPIETRLEAHSQPPSAPAAETGSEPDAARRFDTVRVEVRDLDRLLEVALEARSAGGGLSRPLERLAQAERLVRDAEPLIQPHARGRLRDLLAAIDESRSALGSTGERLERVLDDVTERAARMRLVPAQDVLASLERAARDTASALGKAVEVETRGGESHADPHVLAAFEQAGIHLARNAVAHGIEDPDERLRAGKPRTGRVELAIERRGESLALVCRDDGRGVDVEGVRRAAAARGLSPAGQDLLSLLVQGGVTTARTTTDLAGRGVGLETVRDTALRLRGELDLVSDHGRGTTVEVRAPLSLSTVPLLRFLVRGQPFALPLAAVRRVLRVVPRDVTRTERGDVVPFDGEAVAFAPLSELLGLSARTAQPSGTTAIVLSAGGAHAALGVDRLLGPARATVRPLPEGARDAASLSDGVALDAAGDPELVLDPRRLVPAARAFGRGTPPAPEPRPPVLVIDDSLTTRMLEESILSSAGYDVELATSAEEGLAKARARRFAVFVVDVELPGLSGIDFVARVSADPSLRDVPSVLVTSLEGDADRRRGLEAGARAYIAKGEFDEGRLLAVMRELASPRASLARPA